MLLKADLSTILAVAKMKHEKSSGFDGIRTHASCIYYFGGFYLIFNPQLNSSLVQSVWKSLIWQSVTVERNVLEFKIRSVCQDESEVCKE